MASLRTLILLSIVAVIAADTMVLPIVIHDYYPCISGEIDFSFGAPNDLSYCNPDIEPQYITKNPTWGWGLGTANKGMVQSQIGPNRKPIYNLGSVTNTDTRFQVRNANDFSKWWSDTHPGNKNIQYDLKLVQNDQGLYVYNNQAFYPVDGKGWGNNGPYENLRDHNWGFCAEAHVQFLYDPNASFNFTGDDDMWIFMNNQLAFDIGGIHSSVTQNQRIGDLSFAGAMVKGNPYPMDIFYCERQTYASTISLTTTVNIFCPANQLDACGICGGSGACCKPSRDQCVAPNPCKKAIFNPVDCSCKIVDNLDLINKCNGQSNKCQTSQCDTNSAFPGSCKTAAIPSKPIDACTKASCDPTNGYTYVSTVCPDGNPSTCYPGYCDVSSGGTCKTRDLCPGGVDWCSVKKVVCTAPDLCTVSKCVSNNNTQNGDCVNSPKPNAPQGDYCTTYTCNPATGNYTSTSRVCGDPTNLCQIGSCYPSNSSCVVTNVVCDDNNACTTDSCASKTGNCTFTPIPIDNTLDYCATTICDPVFGFSTTNVTCRGLNCQRDSKTPGCCTCGLSPGQIAGISAGVVAGATVGAVAGAAIIGFGAKKGFDYFAANAASAGGVQNNPLYVDGGNNVNPLHETPSV